MLSHAGGDISGTAEIRWKKGLCGICPSGCWIEARIKDGVLVDIRQDPDSPLGMICGRGQHAPEIVYSRHRLKHPMRRIGPKGSLEFEDISWDAAYGIIVDNLNRIKKESGPEAAAIYTGRGAQELSLCDMFQPEGVPVSSASNVLFPFGSPNSMGVGALCYVSLHMIAPLVTFGRMQTNMFADMDNAEMILIWGTNPATDSPPIDMLRLERAAARGARIVFIDPRLTEAAARTGGQWVPIRPGTDGALALSMLQIMIEEELYDEEFSVKWCHGFRELVTYVQHFRPEVAESITGVPAATIRDLSRDVASASGATLLAYTGLEFSNSGVQSARAILTLFALAGHFDVPGGIGLNMLNTDFPINRSCNQRNPNLEMAVAYDRFPVYSRYRGESHAAGLVDSVLRGQPYRIRALIIHGASILTSWPQTPVWRETLARLDFLACIDRQLTADAAYADVVLPATTMFEIDSYMTYGPVFRLRERLIEPVGEARNDYLIMAELARRLGYGQLFPQSEGEMIRKALSGSGYSPEQVAAEGGHVRIPTPIMEYKKWEKGGLRKDGKPGFETPTGKFEIWSTSLEDYGYEPLPKYVEPVEGPLASPGLAAQFPLVFNSGARPQTDFRSQHHGIDSLSNQNPEPTVEINSYDAERRRIADNDLVEVRTPRGKAHFRARVSTDIIQGAVECAMGGGTPVGPKAWRENNVNDLTDLGNLDPISGFPVYKALLCEVARIAPAETPTAGGGEVSFSPDKVPVLLFGGHSEPTRSVYLDNNATTEVAVDVAEAMLPYLHSSLGNPSSIHGAGRQAKDAVEKSRRQLARLINTQPRRIVFTGGGSESDNQALKGIAFARGGNGKHIVTSSIEHPAVLSTCRFLERIGYTVTYLAVDGDGYLDPAVLERSLDHKTILVSIMMANNEVGTVLPIRDLCAVAHRKGVLFHTDAVQAAGKMAIDVEDLGVDLMSLSGHKFHGPKGAGVLYVRKGIALESLIHGGKQEGGLRAGTENVPAIVGLGEAAQLALASLQYTGGVRVLRDRLESGIRSLLPGARLNGHPVDRLPNTLNMTLPGLRGESLVIAMDQHGVSLSSGSACKSGSPEPTHVLLAMGRTPEEAHCSVRFSLSSSTTDEDIDYTISALASVLQEKNMVRLMPCK